jgi:hypothetical protein
VSVELRVAVEANGKLVPLPTVNAAKPTGTMTDSPPGEPTTILLFGVDSDHGYLYRSHAGATIENDQIRVLASDDLRIVATLARGETFRQPFTSRNGLPMVLVLELRGAASQN